MTLLHCIYRWSVNPTSVTELLHGFSHMFFNTFDEVRLIPGLLEVEVVEVCLMSGFFHLDRSSLYLHCSCSKKTLHFVFLPTLLVSWGLPCLRPPIDARGFFPMLWYATVIFPTKGGKIKRIKLCNCIFSSLANTPSAEMFTLPVFLLSPAFNHSQITLVILMVSSGCMFFAQPG